MRGLLFLALFTQAALASESYKLIKKIEGLKHPESVLFHRGFIYVSDLGADTGETENADGGLHRFSLQGEPDRGFKVSAALNSPMGMAEKDGVIYTVDIDRVVGISLDSGKQVFEASFKAEKTQFLNDVEEIGGKLFITATDIKKIFVLDVDRGTYETLKVDLQNCAPNGITYDAVSDLLYLAANREHKLGTPGNGQVMTVKLSSGSLEGRVLKQVSLGKFLDGVESLNGKLLVSDWNGRGDDGILFGLDPKTLSLIDTVPLNIAGFADFDVLPGKNLLGAPDLINGSYRIFRRE